MKKLLLLSMLALASLTAYSQGTINFASAGAGVNAPATNKTASSGGPGPVYTRAGGAGFLAQLYVGPASTAAASLTTNGISGAPAPFLTGAQAGYFAGGVRTLAGIVGGTTVTFQVRAWNSSFASWEAAPATERSAITVPTIQITVVEPPTPAGNLIGLQGFDIGTTTIPEPSSIALGLLGLGAVALFRRRK